MNDEEEVLSLPPKKESLAERLNSCKESQEDEQDDASAVHARIQAGSGSAGQGGPEHCGGGCGAGRARAVDFQLGLGRAGRQARRGRHEAGPRGADGIVENFVPKWHV
ncbi:hypothetical protein CBM2633_P130002 [Cupriavidus taiwanensis]|uniref:Uncharacterized protein n=2 Tax=Cupriavidus TaxID=106589 RepID=A0A375CLY3_9BURK|nr:hypothetical protein CBM2588_P150002 [Cupriavidus taiwanensis]SOZ40418.1 hypothetical protein CBM2605_P130002 [Cupriavidus neocaledonicus]SOY75306.1 hypothetical protein CBM2589_P130002 [Cupriavidus taiwanensis]SOY77447.1 hypothetical protein CBM2586_P130002 [Cupriavidus taiwanensis]SOZ06774.1 hypothetical protein CBM2599_P120002 [Cupriavidus taiwanensis]